MDNWFWGPENGKTHFFTNQFLTKDAEKDKQVSALLKNKKNGVGASSADVDLIYNKTKANIANTAAHDKSKAIAYMEKTYGLPTGSLAAKYGPAAPAAPAQVAPAGNAATAEAALMRRSADMNKMYGLPTTTSAPVDTTPNYYGAAPSQAGWYKPMSEQERNRIVDAAGGGANAIANLQSEYRTRAAQIAGRYQLAVTPEEKAQLKWELDTLTAQSRAAQGAINTEYTKSIGAAKTASADVRKQSSGWASALQNIYTTAQNSIKNGEVKNTDFAEAGDTAGAGLVSADVAGPDATAVLAANGAEQAATSLGQSNLTADDLTWLAASGASEQSAQVAGIQNTTTNYKAQATAAATKAWNDRIQKEWEAQQAALDSLDSTYTQRGWSVNDARSQALSNLMSSDYDQRMASSKDVYSANNDYAQRVAEFKNAFTVDAYTKAQEAQTAAATTGQYTPIASNGKSYVFNGSPEVGGKVLPGANKGSLQVDAAAAADWWNTMMADPNWFSSNPAERQAARGKARSNAPAGFLDTLQLMGVQVYS